MRVLIIGGTSFIGPSLVRRLVEIGHDVAVFHRGQTRADLPNNVRHIVGDRHDFGRYLDEFHAFGAEVVVDMIAFTEADASGLVQTFRGLARRTVVISSADVYRAYGRFLGQESGPIEATPLTENSPLRTILFPYRNQAKEPDDFFSSYDKIPVERVVMREPDLPSTVLRLPMVHGPGDAYHRLSPYLQRMDDRRTAIVLDERMARWKCPRGYVVNVAAAIALATVDERASGRIYNVAEPCSCTEAEWVSMIGEVAGWDEKVVTVDAGRIAIPLDIEQNLDTDSSRIRKELGYTELVSPREGLERTVAWERANRSGESSGLGLLNYDSEDAILADLRRAGESLEDR